MWIAENDGREIAFDTIAGMLDAFRDIELVREFADYPITDVVEVIVRDSDVLNRFDVLVRYAPHTMNCEYDTPAECETALTSDDADDVAFARACESASREFDNVATINYRAIRHIIG